MFVLASKHRNSIMGCAALLIVIHHYLTEIIGKPYKIGAIGVDIFMFAMGIGLYYSLFKRSKDDKLIKALPSYFMRRIIRIIPSLTFTLIAWGMWKHVNGGFTVKAFFLNLSLTGYWTLSYGQYFNWFVSAILFFYVLSPFVFLVINKSNKKLLLSFFLFISLSLLIFLMRKNDNGEIHRTLIMVVRLLPFVFGMLFGSFGIEDSSEIQKKITTISIIILFVIGLILHFCNNIYWKDAGFTYGMPWYGFGLMTPFVFVVLAYVFEFLLKTFKIITYAFSFLGKMSFELYLSHIFIIENIMVELKKQDNLWFAEPMNFVAALFTSVIFAYALKLVTDRISKYKIIK